VEIAQEIGLDVKKFTSDLDAHTYKTKIDAEVAQAMQAGATGTPATFVNGRFVNGAAPIDTFKKMIDEELAKATK
jgi:predicted DsbA family dithiol-disulfide isomerase